MFRLRVYSHLSHFFFASHVTSNNCFLTECCRACGLRPCHLDINLMSFVWSDLDWSNITKKYDLFKVIFTKRKFVTVITLVPSIATTLGVMGEYLEKSIKPFLFYKDFTLQWAMIEPNKVHCSVWPVSSSLELEDGCCTSRIFVFRHTLSAFVCC